MKVEERGRRWSTVRLRMGSGVTAQEDHRRWRLTTEGTAASWCEEAKEPEMRSRVRQWRKRIRSCVCLVCGFSNLRVFIFWPEILKVLTKGKIKNEGGKWKCKGVGLVGKKKNKQKRLIYFATNLARFILMLKFSKDQDVADPLLFK